MKISILTFSKENNNGANLQCYALVETLKSLGHDVDIIDIQLPAVNFGIINKIIHWPQYYNYVKFRKKYLNCFSQQIHSIDDLKKETFNSDLFIVGSDQVWNPDITKRLDSLVYFFNFLPESARRMSYAASFGVNEWKWDYLTDDVQTLLRKFEYISVREAEGVELCKKTFGLEVSEVCDPTFLLHSYDKICGQYNPNKESNELVYFKFTRNRQVENFLLNQSKLQRMKLVKLGDFHPQKGCIYRPYYSIKKWLNSIRYAKLIVTDSFHCKAFCVLFNKQFIAMPSSISRSSRIINLLRNLGLSDRFCIDFQELQKKYDSLYATTIDYRRINPLVDKLKNQGLCFLKQIR